LDPGFKVFFDYCKSASIPVVIVSSGMVPIIRAILENLIGQEDASKISIIANDVKYLDGEQKGEKWTIEYRHPESGFGHDKSKATAPYRELKHQPTLFFCGDGVSDLSAARAADLLFVKVIEGVSLVVYQRTHSSLTTISRFAAHERFESSLRSGKHSLRSFLSREFWRSLSLS
jgi:2-hydroxy-3-keto-5-methylthiopentenyl-1-phosphate phosphatase